MARPGRAAWLSVFAVVLAVAGAPSAAQDGYPAKPVRIVAPFPPGGSTDVLCRLIAQKLVIGEFFQVITGTKLVHVPYKGGAVAMIDLVAGQTDLQFGDMVPAVPQVRSGKLRALAVTTRSRSAALPDVPTMAKLLKAAGIEPQ